MTPGGAWQEPAWGGPSRLLALLPLILLLSGPSYPQSRTVKQGPHRMEITLERRDGDSWHTIDPALVLEQGDRVRFGFRSNFDGFLYVTNYTTSGTYEQLFPRKETGQDNRIAANRDYQVPAAASMVFRVTGPAGYERVYWLVSPTRLTDLRPETMVPDSKLVPPITLLPRCDDTILRARGDCIDHGAGPKLVPRGEALPQGLAGAAGDDRKELLLMRQKDKSVISSPVPLTGPVVYEFRLAHR